MNLTFSDEMLKFKHPLLVDATLMSFDKAMGFFATESFRLIVTTRHCLLVMTQCSTTTALYRDGSIHMSFLDIPNSRVVFKNSLSESEFFQHTLVTDFRELTYDHITMMRMWIDHITKHEVNNV